MRPVILLTLFSLLLFNCKRSEDVVFEYGNFQTDKKVLGVFLTATWSDRSGETGLTAYNTFVQDSFPNRVIPIVAHAATVGDPFYSLSASQFYSLYEAEQFPSFGLNVRGIPFIDIDELYRYTREELTDTVNGMPQAAKPKLVMATAKRVEGRKLRCKTKIRIVEPLDSSELRAAIYITENDVLGFQQGSGGLIFHQNVLRAAITAGPWGELIKVGEFEAGEEFEKEAVFSMNEDTDSNQLYMVVVVYRMQNGFPVEVLNCSRF